MTRVNGILLLDKSENITSNRALQQVKRLFNADKAGHTGSLDPLATGVLPICFGEATKFSQFLLEADKKYLVKAKLGIETITGDREGEVVVTLPVNVSNASILNAMKSFVGTIQQVPPMYSALKHQGQPLYKLARKGIEVERQPREIQIFSLDLIEYASNEIVLKVHCSKGTYIRTLIQDLGRCLECGAHVVELRRTHVSPFLDHEIYPFSKLEVLRNQGQLQTTLLPMEAALANMPTLELSQAASFYLRQGQAVRSMEYPEATFVRLISEDKSFLGIGEMTATGFVKPYRLVA